MFRLSYTEKRHPSVDRWLENHQGPPGALARRWFEILRHCGDDVRETLHDGQPTACVQEAAFAYVDAFTSHVNIGFFHGAELPDPNGLLEGTGKYMRHVKLLPEVALDEQALSALIEAAYADVKKRLAEERAGKSRSNERHEVSE